MSVNLKSPGSASPRSVVSPRQRTLSRYVEAVKLAEEEAAEEQAVENMVDVHAAVETAVKQRAAALTSVLLTEVLTPAKTSSGASPMHGHGRGPLMT